MVLRAVLVTCIFIVIGMLASEIRGWCAGTKRVTTLQKALRITSASLMVTILAMVLAGDKWVYHYGPLAVMAYWIVCFTLAGLLIVLALFDIREVGITYGKEKRRMYRNLTQRSDHDDKV